MNTHIRVFETPTRAYAQRTSSREIPPPPFEFALARVRQEARTRAGMACGVVIAALVQFLPGGGAHGFAATALALAPAIIIAAVAFPLISWAAARAEARLRLHYGIRRQ
jgi:hypothetical protein